jgi:hypothetical protein
MKISRAFKMSLAALAFAVAVPASAAVVVLDFEGIPDQSPVGDYYNGAGPASKNFGISFSQATLALIDADAGGGGNFGNEPSPNTIMFFLQANNAILNVAAGFTTGFSFFYTSSTAATINIYDGLNATGNLLASIVLAAQFTDNCVGDPTGTFCNFTAIGVAFAGTAKSIDFGGTANQTGYDNITFGSSTPGGAPEPGTLALLALGALALGAARRKQRR